MYHNLWEVYHDGNLLELEWLMKTSKITEATKVINEKSAQLGTPTSNDGDKEICSVTSAKSSSVPVNRICVLCADTILLLTADHCLYEGCFNEETKTLKLQLQRCDIIDVDYCKKLNKIFIVTCSGMVFMQPLNGMNNCNDDWNSITFDPLELSEDGIRIRRVSCSEFGVLFVSKTNDVYALGSCGDVFSVGTEQPKHLRLFDENTSVINLEAGDEFFVVLLQKAYDQKQDPLDLYTSSRDKRTDTAQISIVKPNNEINKYSDSTASALTLPTIQLEPAVRLRNDFSVSDNNLAASNSSPLVVDKRQHQELNSNSSLHSFSESSKSSTQHHAHCTEDQIRRTLLKSGYALLHTQVHTLGASNNGLLGTGDHIKRSANNNIQKLDSIGVCSVAAGREHSVARTIDGRLFQWGLNTKQQLNGKIELCDLSAPTEFLLDKSGLSAEQRNVLAVSCGDYPTILLNARGELYDKQRGKGLKSQQTTKEDLNAFPQQQTTHSQNNNNNNIDDFKEYPLLLSAGLYTVYNRGNEFQRQYHSPYQTLQLQLRNLLKYNHAIEMLKVYQEKSNAMVLKHLQSVCTKFQCMLYLLIAALKSFESFYCGLLKSPSDLIFVKYYRDYISLFGIYTRSYCDIFSIDGYVEASKALARSPNVPLMPDQRDEMDLARIFQQPFQMLSGFLQFFEILTKTQSEYTEHFLAWQALSRKHSIELELAESTQEFWRRNARNQKIKHFRRKHRRVILTSTSVPIKLSQNTISMSTTTFILFSDCLCQLGSHLYTYPLASMWLKIESDTALRIITPERSFTIVAPSHHNKMLWYDQLESSILTALGKPLGSKMPSVRTAAYVFSSSHQKYPNVHVFGRWRKGMLHGNCYMEYPDGRIYFGEMRRGEMEGYGKMIIPSVGFYEGRFKNGKFQGQGVLEMKDNEIYEGNFREGLFDGHGFLRTNTYTYVGDYEANSKVGYGVLDNTLTGDKYMGMFADNKRSGHGTCITMSGDYFEGIFANDELSGTGIAVLENGYYYEGELSMRGPMGKGTYYMPTGSLEIKTPDEHTDDNDDVSNRTLIGNVLSGQLGGNWQDLRIISGNISINRNFPKYPKSIGELVVDNERKWRTLFDNFEEQLSGNVKNSPAYFGSVSKSLSALSSLKSLPENTAATNNATVNSATKHIWSRIAVYITTQREREQLSSEQQQMQQKSTINQSQGSSYFAQNIAMGFLTNSSLDKFSFKQSQADNSKFNIFDHSGNGSGSFSAGVGNNSLTAPFESSKRSQSQETLFDSVFGSTDFNDADYLSSHSVTLSQNDEHTQAMSSFVSANFSNWSVDMFGASMLASSSGTPTSSLRSSLDSVVNLNEAFNSSSYSSQSNLDYIPSFGITTLNEDDILAIKAYLAQAFKDCFHPLHALNQRISNCFYSSYGCWKVKPTPILAKQATREWESICRRVYQFVRKMFPALPQDFCVIETTREVVSYITLLYPILLSEGIYSTLFVLYANKYSQKDELYRQNLLNAEKVDDSVLATQLGLQSSLLPVVSSSLFNDAIQSLKQLQEKYSPKEMLTVIENCMQLITDAHKVIENEHSTVLAADCMMPLTLVLILRAAVPHLGAELALLDDLTGGANFQFEMNGIAGYCYTTLKAAYEHITSKRFNYK